MARRVSPRITRGMGQGPGVQSELGMGVPITWSRKITVSEGLDTQSPQWLGQRTKAFLILRPQG